MPGADLPTLGRSFARLRTRSARQSLRVRQLAAEADKIAKARGIGHLRGPRRYHSAWTAWSGTADTLADLVAEIISQPARTLPEVAVKFDALLWLLLSDEAVVDHEAELQACRFRSRASQDGSRAE